MPEDICLNFHAQFDHANYAYFSECIKGYFYPVIPLRVIRIFYVNFTGMNYSNIVKPSLLLDPHRCQANIHRMAQKAIRCGTELRPHFKTHQSKEVGRWFRDSGTKKITVSSVGMAYYFWEDGWDDITVAFPVNIRQIEEIAALSTKIKLGLLLVDDTAVEVLGNRLNHEVSIWIKIDVGTHRTGLSYENMTGISKILDALKSYPQLHFAGFLAHAGHSYHGRSVTEVQRIYDESLAILIDLRNDFLHAYPDIRISLGDTPGASMVRDFGAVDELRPGNYVFYDLMQAEIGACVFDDIAVTMACPVVAIHPERKQWIIYGGGIHFSKDFLSLDDGHKCFGRMADITGDGWNAGNAMRNPFLVSLSQEHGVVQCSEDNFNKCKPGDISLWLPVHSCMTADAMGEYRTLQGEHIDHYRKRVFE